ncbi:MAG: DUF1573 domain-containing protein [Candidatus Omnitrophota bacterium]|nr:DUF1573 domain-containing protein [Candidatus Omnitrophota bacterium]
MKRVILLISILFIAVTAFSEEAAGPRIEIVTPDADIGTAQKGNTLDFKVEVKNSGASDLIIEDVYSTCGCFEVNDPRWPEKYRPLMPNPKVEKPKPVTIKSGEMIFISVRLDTNKVSGQFEKTLHIASNDPEKRMAEWRIRGVVLDSATALSQDVRSNSIEKASVPRPGARVVKLFYVPGCKECIEIREKFFPGLKEKYGDKIYIEEYNIDNQEAFSIFLDMQNKYDKRARRGFFNPKPPAVFIKDRFLYGAKDIKRKLEGLLRIQSPTT